MDFFFLLIFSRWLCVFLSQHCLSVCVCVCVCVQVSGVDLRAASHEEAVSAIKSAPSPVVFIVQSLSATPRVLTHPHPHPHPHPHTHTHIHTHTHWSPIQTGWTSQEKVGNKTFTELVSDLTLRSGWHFNPGDRIRFTPPPYRQRPGTLTHTLSTHTDHMCQIHCEHIM